MLGTLGDAAEKNGWLRIREEAGAGLMGRVMNTGIPRILASFDRDTRMRLTGLGLWEFNAHFDYVERKREITPLLRDDLVAISEATENKGILILIDEVSSKKTALKELSRFALEISHAITAGINIVVAFAGVNFHHPPDDDLATRRGFTIWVRRLPFVGLACHRPSVLVSIDCGHATLSSAHATSPSFSGFTDP